MERVGLRGMLDLSGLSARKIHFKSWIRDKGSPTRSVSADEPRDELLY
jgi:hypothetical protein